MDAGKNQLSTSRKQMDWFGCVSLKGLKQGCNKIKKTLCALISSLWLIQIDLLGSKKKYTVDFPLSFLVDFLQAYWAKWNSDKLLCLSTPKCPRLLESKHFKVLLCLPLLVACVFLIILWFWLLSFLWDHFSTLMIGLWNSYFLMFQL